jgi:hypothetical protein
MKLIILARQMGVSVMLVQRLGIVFAIFLVFALAFGSVVNHAKSGRLAHPDSHSDLFKRQN